MERLTILLLAVLAHTATAQVVLKGIVKDSTTRDGVAFAHITLEDHKTGIITDIDGNFRFPLPAGYQGKLLVSHISYTTRQFDVATLANTKQILLSPNVTNLKELVFRASENPAWRIMRKLVRNRDQHKPSLYPYYSYTAYTKVLATGKGKGFNKDSLIAVRQAQNKPVTSDDSLNWQVEEFFEKNHIFLSESVTEKFFRQPDKNYEKLVAHKVSGFQSPLFTSLPNDFQPLGFYDDTMTLMGKDFLNPVSKNSEKKYDFTLTDTLYAGRDTIYVIAYEPLPQTNFNGLKGKVSVSTDGYALKNIIASSTDPHEKLNFVFQQNYEKVNGRWFPSQLITDIVAPQFKFGTMHLLLQSKSYLQNVQFIEPERKIFRGAEIDLSQSAGDSVLVKYRVTPLDDRDESTYTMYDSLRKEFRLLRMMDNLSEGFISATLPLGKVDVAVKDLVTINKYEGARISASFVTNPHFSKWITIGARAGYGFRDEAWKYGGFMRFNFDTDRNFYLQFGYDNSLTEAGQQNFEPEQKAITNKSLRNWLGQNFDSHEMTYARTGIDIFNNWHWQIGISQTDLRPNYTYTLQQADVSYNAFQLTELTSELTFIGQQRKISYNGRSSLFAFSRPIFSVQVSRSLPNTFNSDDFEYTRFNVLLAEQWKHRRLGTTRWYAVGGWVEGLAPFNRLYYGRGARETGYEVQGYFQTMGFNEFAADRFGALFVSQNFGPVFYNSKNSRPELIISQAAGVGRFTQASNHIFETRLPDFDRGYFESGIGLNNIVRINYVDVAHLGIGGSLFYRYGPYALDKFNDNLAFRLNLTFSF